MSETPPSTPSQKPPDRRAPLLWAAGGLGLGVAWVVVYQFARPAAPHAQPEERRGRLASVLPALGSEAETNADADPDLQLLSRMQNGFQKIARRVQPSVVSLSGAVSAEELREEFPRPGDSLIPPPLDRTLTGSGVILNAEGAILTNEHVVRGAKTIRVTLADGAVYKARVTGYDRRSDLAVLRPLQAAPPKGLTPVVMADSDQVAVGQYAIAVGNPFDLANTMTVGIVSARGRTLPAGSFASSGVIYGDLIQTDAAINPGNSGGPLFNLRGELIGINTMIFSKTGRFEGFGFAIPSNHVKRRLACLLKGQPVEYGWLGVVLDNLEPDNSAFKDRGVLVERVIPDSPADRAGLEQGCVILLFDGVAVTKAGELILAVGLAAPGKLTPIRMRNRQGEVVEVPVRIGLRPSQEQEVMRLSRFEPLDDSGPDMEKAGEITWRGLRVRELSSEEAAQCGGSLRVVRVKKGSPADRAGLYEGAILDEIKYGEQAGLQALQTLTQFRRITHEAKGPVYLHSPVAGYVSLEAEEAP